MRTASSISLLSKVTVLAVLCGWSATASAAHRTSDARALAQSSDVSGQSANKAESPAPSVSAKDDASKDQPAPSGAEAPKAAVALPAVPGTEAVSAEQAGQVEAPPTPDPPSVLEVGIQRLPDTAYPQPLTRGLPYGSLSLTFHGLQWPYMPAAGKSPRFVVGVSGWGWVDTSFVKFAPWGEHPDLEGSKIRYWKQQSRLLLRVTPTYSLDDGYFIQGQVEMVGTGDQTLGRSAVGGQDTDDLWLRFGKWNKWDLQVGRFEGWEVFHLGMGLDQNTFERQGAFGGENSIYAISFYGLTDNQFRPQGAAGNMAFHYYPLRVLRFEMLGMAGSFGGPAYAARPVGILDLGWLKLKGGTEYSRESGLTPSIKNTTTKRGVAGAIQFVFLPHIEFGLNAAQGTVRVIDKNGALDSRSTLTRTTFGGFANVSNGSVKHPLLFGVGAMYTHTEDQNNLISTTDLVDKYWMLQSYAAVQYVAMQQLYIKLVAGYSRAHWASASTDPVQLFDDEMYSLRLRFALYF